MTYDTKNSPVQLSQPEKLFKEQTKMEGSSILHSFTNIYFAIFALFCFKLLIKISLALLTHFYIVKGNRKEAARIAEEIYGIVPGTGTRTQVVWDDHPKQGNQDLAKRNTAAEHFGQNLYEACIYTGSWADRSPLHDAAFQGRLLSLKTLIAQGVNVNLVTTDRVSALHEACLGGHLACAKLLLEHGAQVNAVTIDGITPLFNACCSGSAACVSMLLEFGAKAQLGNHLPSPIHEAVKRGHRECMETLLAHEVDIDQEDPQHGTPLYVACTYQRTGCVKKLLELGANVNMGKRLDTPLHAAARKSSVEIVVLLTDYGANPKCRNADLKCALDLAMPHSKVEQALLLREGTLSVCLCPSEALLTQRVNGALPMQPPTFLSLLTTHRGPKHPVHKKPTSKQLLHGPASLAQLCRLCIRRCLGRSCLYTVHRLHLPEPLENFLLYR